MKTRIILLLLVLSAVVGFTDITPYVLSLLHPSAAMARSVVLALTVAMMSNTTAKAIYFASIVPEARRETFLRYGVWAALHIPLLLV